MFFIRKWGSETPVYGGVGLGGRRIWRITYVFVGVASAHVVLVGAKGTTAVSRRGSTETRGASIDFTYIL